MLVITHTLLLKHKDSDADNRNESHIKFYFNALLGNFQNAKNIFFYIGTLYTHAMQDVLT